ncbi:hypothetical protein LA080_005076 [Diaporthe eres]|nr:hypothetical protein LA080_005076 [Diaporthe eres]
MGEVRWAVDRDLNQDLNQDLSQDLGQGLNQRAGGASTFQLPSWDSGTQAQGDAYHIGRAPPGDSSAFALLFQMQALLARSLEDDDGRTQVQIAQWLMGSNLVKPSQRAASGRRPAASSALVTQRDPENWGPLSWRAHYPAYPVRTAWYAGQVPYLLPLPTCAPLPVESAVPLIKHQPRMSSLPTIIYLISAGATGMMMHPQPAHTAARRHQRQRQRQRLFDGHLDLDQDLDLDLALIITHPTLSSTLACALAAL